MLARPMKRIWPSLICVARSNIRRHVAGLKNGNSPSTTSISAPAASSVSQKPGTRYFFAVAWGGASGPPLRMALKNSLAGSTTIMSDLLRKLER